jgi:hypothetical protein
MRAEEQTILATMKSRRTSSSPLLATFAVEVFSENLPPVLSLELTFGAFHNLVGVHHQISYLPRRLLYLTFLSLTYLRPRFMMDVTHSSSLGSLSADEVFESNSGTALESEGLTWQSLLTGVTYALVLFGVQILLFVVIRPRYPRV